jgi:DNA-directed RNA polymerase subunit F
MAGKKKYGGKLVSVPEVLDILEDRKKEGELGYEQTLAYEYAGRFSKLKGSDAKRMKKELEELGLDERLALKFIEIMPDDASLAKLILAMDKNRQPAEDETVNKILAVVKSYSK